MRRRFVPLALIALLVILHGQVWFGRGSVSKVAQLRSQLSEQIQRNQRSQLNNSQLEAELRDLREGLEIVEEKARMELGMIKTNEIYVQIAR
jgi:cell division protein FtsB